MKIRPWTIGTSVRFASLCIPVWVICQPSWGKEQNRTKQKQTATHTHTHTHTQQYHKTKTQSQTKNLVSWNASIKLHGILLSWKLWVITRPSDGTVWYCSMNNRLLGVEEILVAVLCNPFILRMGMLRLREREQCG